MFSVFSLASMVSAYLHWTPGSFSLLARRLSSSSSLLHLILSRRFLRSEQQLPSMFGCLVLFISFFNGDLSTENDAFDFFFFFFFLVLFQKILFQPQCFRIIFMVQNSKLLLYFFSKQFKYFPSFSSYWYDFMCNNCVILFVCLF